MKVTFVIFLPIFLQSSLFHSRKWLQQRRLLSLWQNERNISKRKFFFHSEMKAIKETFSKRRTWRWRWWCHHWQRKEVWRKSVFGLKTSQLVQKAIFLMPVLWCIVVSSILSFQVDIIFNSQELKLLNFLLNLLSFNCSSSVKMNSDQLRVEATWINHFGRERKTDNLNPGVGRLIE